ncbi:unnamed protein product [Microthlaspi erraticum]|uniref:Transposase Tnp1/En/Spm-like domain-containing protein n=1 Tax=Microthlaspi erraticum TaxID=1685480 RepID=A0A6D2K073_9BRAS|nr:unnamed protein product [Microthlaspi erraticum]
MGKTKKTGKKRKNVGADVEPEFIGTIYEHQDGVLPQETHLNDTQPEEAERDKDNEEHEPELDSQPEAAVSEDGTNVVKPITKKARGPTKMKDIARDPNSRIRVDFTEFGEPCGERSIKLSSYLGPLVREHVPVLIDDWRKIGEDRKTVLWRSVKIRFELNGEYEKAAVMKQMGCLWRASKSRLVKQIIKAKNHTERMKLKPDNIPTPEWRKFVKQKTSPEFKKKESSDPSDVSRLSVWVKSRTKKDGTAVNTDAAAKIERAKEFVQSDAASESSSNPKEDTLAQILGPDNPGRLRAMGRGMSLSKLACFQVKSKYVSEMQYTQVRLQQQVNELQEALAKLNSNRSETDVGENSGQRSVNQKTQSKCILFDWSGSEYKVVEGRILSSDHMDFVNNIPLGPNSVKVVVETAVKGDAFLWRPAQNMFNIAQAVGETIAWPQNCVVAIEDELQPEDIPPKSPSTTSLNKCKLLNWLSNDEEPVAEGRWQTRDPKALVNGLPLGPKAIKVFVDAVIDPDTFLWRPTEEFSYLHESLKTFVAWPVGRVLFDDLNTEATASPRAQPQLLTPPAPVKSSKPASQSTMSGSPQQISPTRLGKEERKCKLLDISGDKRIVAEGRWSSNDPEVLVHFVPLGDNGVRVWVDVVKVNDALVWRPFFSN